MQLCFIQLGPLLVFKWHEAPRINHNELSSLFSGEEFSQIIFSALKVYFERLISDRKLSGNCYNCYLANNKAN